MQLFEVFWGQITELFKARPEFSLEDIMGLLLSLSSLSLNCYPDRLDYVDLIFGTAIDSILRIQSDQRYSNSFNKLSESIFDGHSITLILHLLLGPISTYSKDLLVLLKLPSGSASGSFVNGKKSQNLGGNFTDLLFLQPYSTRRQVAHKFISAMLKSCTIHKFQINSIDGVNFVLGEVASVMVRDQVDGGLFGSIPMENAKDLDVSVNEPQVTFHWEDVSEEQINLAKFVHVIQKTQSDETFYLLTAARDHFIQGGDLRIRFSLVPLVMSLLNLAKTIPSNNTSENYNAVNVKAVLLTVHDIIGMISRAREAFQEDDEYLPLFQDDVQLLQSTTRLLRALKSPPDMALHLYLISSKCADDARQEELCYEFFVQVLSITINHQGTYCF